MYGHWTLRATLTGVAGLLALGGCAGVAPAGPVSPGVAVAEVETPVRALKPSTLWVATSEEWAQEAEAVYAEARAM